MTVAARPQCAHTFVGEIGAGQRDDWQVRGRWRCAQLPRHFPPVDIRKTEIEHDDINLARMRSRQRVVPVAHGDDVVAAAPEEFAEPVPRGRVVVSEEDSDWTVHDAPS